MENFNPNCYWVYHCDKDSDFIADWGNFQRPNLQYVRINLLYRNEIDGWTSISKTHSPPNPPTSDPFTFFARIYHIFCRNDACAHSDYYGKKYKFNTLFEIVTGGNGGAFEIEDYGFSGSSVSDNLKFCKTDPFYEESIPSCTAMLPDC